MVALSTKAFFKYGGIVLNNSNGEYVIRKKVLTVLGAKFHLYDPQGNLVGFSKQKAFKLKEDIRLYASEDLKEEVLLIQARSIIDFAVSYDVTDTATGQRVGSLRRKGLASMLRDTWIILDAEEREIGRIEEDSMMLAFVRRFATNLIPQKFIATVEGMPVCIYKQNFNPFVRRLAVAFTPEAAGRYDRRLGIAAGLLLLAIEGTQG
jgi:hypothetical protein